MVRPIGTANILSTEIKHSIMSVYNALGGAEELLKWGKNNQTEYYKMLVAILPKNLDVDVTKRTINVNIDLYGQINGGHQPKAISETSESSNE